MIFTRDLSVRDVSLRQEVALKASPAHFLEAGAELHALDTRWQWRIDGDRNESEANGSSIQGGTGLPSDLDSQRDTFRAGAWLLDRWQAAPRLLVEPGLRVDWSGVGDEVIASPRLAANLELGTGLETPEETAARVALYQFPAELQDSVPTAPQITSTPENGATGRAYGFDVYVTRRPTSASERFAGWASYT